MSKSEKSNGPNGATSEMGWQPRDARSLGDQCRQIRHDAHALAHAVQGATDDLERYITAGVEERPYATLGAAAGVGYILGGGLRPRLTAMLLGAATRLAMALAARELTARLSPGASAPIQNKGS